MVLSLYIYQTAFIPLLIGMAIGGILAIFENLYMVLIVKNKKPETYTRNK